MFKKKKEINIRFFKALIPTSQHVFTDSLYIGLGKYFLVPMLIMFTTEWLNVAAAVTICLWWHRNFRKKKRLKASKKKCNFFFCSSHQLYFQLQKLKKEIHYITTHTHPHTSMHIFVNRILVLTKYEKSVLIRLDMLLLNKKKFFFSKKIKLN